MSFETKDKSTMTLHRSILSCAGAFFITCVSGMTSGSPDAASFRAGEVLDPAGYGAGVVEGWDVVEQRDRNRGPDWVANNRGRNGAQGVWAVPSLGATYHPNSGQRYITNKWGDTSMGIGFGGVVDVEGVYVAGQAARGAWTTGLRVIGYRGGVEIGRTGWFTDIDAEPSYFSIDLGDVDRIVFESTPVLNGGGWYALDDLAFARAATESEETSAMIVLDFEDCRPRQVLTGTAYGGLTWETGTGAFTGGAADDEGDAIHAPRVPAGYAEAEASEASPPPASPIVGFGTLPQLQQTFDGVVRGDEGSWSFPPDSCGAVGPDHFVVVVNRVIAAYKKDTGAKLVGSSLSAFLPGSSGDPRVLYDQSSGRWIVLVTDFSARYYLAASLTDDPTGNWFKTDFVVSAGSDSGRWPDYPTLGVNADGIYAASYMVGGDARMTIFAIDKAPLIETPPALGTVTAFRGLPFEGAIQPVHTYGEAPGEFFVSRGSTTTLNVRLLTGPLTSPVLSEAQAVDIPSHQFPPDVPAKGSYTPLDSVGHRLMNAVYTGGTIWTAHTIALDGRAASRWYQIDGETLELAQYGTVSDPVLNFWFPSIAANAFGDAVMGFSGAFEDQYAGAYYTGRRRNDIPGQMATPMQYREGVASQNNIDSYGRNRWGDYSLCSIDPDDEMRFFTIQEYGHGKDIWGTAIADLMVTEGPPNDGCYTLMTACEGETEFSTVGATTDGPDEVADCLFDGFSQIDADIWFKFTPPCDGEVTISLCGSAFDTKLAVYRGCPEGPGEVIACDDDACGLQSEVTFAAQAGDGLRIRIGGKNGAEGEGVMMITCIPDEPACPGDVSGDGVVDVLDILAVLAAWGETGELPADVSGDGVVDVLDLLAVLGDWGPCE